MLYVFFAGLDIEFRSQVLVNMEKCTKFHTKASDLNINTLALQMAQFSIFNCYDSKLLILLDQTHCCIYIYIFLYVFWDFFQNEVPGEYKTGHL